jgi:AmmeMemoRadiSam system protein B/AmmeMemoRadiSam system protein A
LTGKTDFSVPHEPITGSAMKQNIHPFLMILLMYCLTCVVSVETVNADITREAVYAGSFYPATRSALKTSIEQLVSQVKPVRVDRPPHTSLKAIIIPHAGYIYAGLTAAHVSRVLKENRFFRAIVMGSDHRIGFQGCAISDVNAYETPLGSIRIHGDAVRLRQDKNLFRSVPLSDRLEHSVEVVLPYLQYFLLEFEFIPIVTGQGRNLDKRVSAALDPFLDRNTLLVASSDLSHFLPYKDAVARDRETIEIILNLEADKLNNRENAACGKIPILILINMARRYGWKAVLLHYSNSGDTAGDRSRVVGYGAIAFYGGSSMQHSIDSPQSLDKHQGQTLVRLARQTIAEKLGKSSIKSDPEDLEDAAFQTSRGTFVTLTIDKQLRGCIGNLEPRESILAGIKRNAINAAFHDPRFPPLKPAELDRVDIEVSILTEPYPLEYRDSEDLLAKLRVHVDGVILRKGSASATFLPQVWAQLPRPEEFLSHLCMKAGLGADTWRRRHLEILIYQVQYFEEAK